MMGGFRYPVSLEVEGRRCVVVGGGTVAEHKARALIEAGAAVAVVAGEVTIGLEELATAGALEAVHRAYADGDLEGAFLAIAATDDPGVNAAVYEEGDRAGVLVNSVDDVEHCHFAVPSIVRQGDLTVAISTGGKAPALSKRLRKELSNRFGPEYAVLVDLVGEVRIAARPVRERVDFDTWAARWETALSDQVVALVSEGRIDEARARLLAALAGDPALVAAPLVTPCS
ncbi:MAG: bifunctional precorrin-2 dehydrogenase/sirohydrochlorin ferrochelatase [Actinomycetota bacterium]|nr:bifunctional precorrin-2 dehydrogenase/sirohydrochlorin ferrochelatase [Actinomycetota bacterium]